MKDYALLEAALSCGSPTTGSEFAYDALMAAGLDRVFPDALCFPAEKLPRCAEYPEKLKFLGTVMAVNRLLYRNLTEALDAAGFPIVIGGDHSAEMGVLAALGEKYGADNLALVYIDAHADINTEEQSVSHFIHGMDLAAACGLCTDELTVGKNKINIRGENIHIIGARSIDPPEWGNMERLGVHLHTADEVREMGADGVLREVLPALAGKRLHISFDVDSLDPAVFSSTGYRIPNGLTEKDAEKLLRALLPLASSFDCVEYNPALDRAGKDAAKLIRFFEKLDEWRKK